MWWEFRGFIKKIWLELGLWKACRTWNKREHSRRQHSTNKEINMGQMGLKDSWGDLPAWLMWALSWKVRRTRSVTASQLPSELSYVGLLSTNICLIKTHLFLILSLMVFEECLIYLFIHQLAWEMAIQRLFEYSRWQEAHSLTQLLFPLLVSSATNEVFSYFWARIGHHSASFCHSSERVRCTQQSHNSLL